MEIEDVSKENDMNLHNSFPDLTANTDSPNTANSIVDKVLQCNEDANVEYPDQDGPSKIIQIEDSSYSKTTEPISEPISVNINTNKDESDQYANSLDNNSKHDDRAPISLSRKNRSRIILESSDSEAEINENLEQDDTPTAETENISTLRKSQKHKRIAVFDSDSESELKNDEEHHNTLTNATEVLNLLGKSQKHKRAFLDSDSEAESNNELEPSEGQKSTPIFAGKEISLSGKSKKHKRIASYIDIDMYSDDDENMDFITPHNKSFDEDTSAYKKDNVDSAIVYTTNSKGEIVPENEKNNQVSRLALLCDSDSEDDLVSAQQNSSDVDLSDHEVIERTQQQGKSKSGTKKPAKSKLKKSKAIDAEDLPKKMTVKEAAKQRQEIQSESQRMLREKNVSLPYHKPKSHSLKEFLARRPTLSRAVPVVGRAPASVAIKMSTEQLEMISKKLKEREKEVKEFYKSASESDNDGSDNEYVPPIDEQKQSEETSNGNTKDNLTPSIELDIPCDTSHNANKELSPDDKSNSIKESLCSSHDHIEKEPQSDIPSVNVVDSVNVNSVIIQSPGDQGNENEVMPARDELQTETPMDFGDVPQTSNTEESANSNLAEELLELPFRSDTVLPGDNLTESYDFHLEDDNTERDAPGNFMEKGMDNLDESATKEKAVPQEFSYTDLDREIESYSNPQENIPQDEPSLPNVKSRLELLKEQLANDKPRLSGGPNDVIDLDYGVAKPREVVQLMERFVKHASAKKHHPKHKVKLSIVTVESGGDIHQEEVAMNVDSDEETAESEEKPGAKLQKLKGELQKQMEQKKTQLWQQKAARGFRVGLENDEDTKGDEKDILDYDEEEEAEMTDEEELEEEEIENDIEITDKPRETAAFLDEEAEVTDEEESDTSPKEGYEDQIEDPEGDQEVENIDNESDNDEDEIKEDDNLNISGESQSSEPTKNLEEKKALRRIIKPVDDSDEEDLFNDSAIHKSAINAHLDSTVTADEEEIPPHQPRQLHTPVRPAISQTKSISDFLTPISFITSIQNLTSAAKSIKGGSVVSPFRMPENLQSPDKESKTMPQKKLFIDSEVLESQGSIDISYSQENDVEAAPTEEAVSVPNETLPSTQDLLGICSGQFTGVTQLDSTENTNQLTEFGSSQSSDLKCLGQEDMIISQLLDEEELENFKKKFESPINPVSQRHSIFEAEEVTGGGIIDSDEDDEGEEQQKKKKKNQKRIQFSDDESSDAEVEDEIDLEDKGEIDEDDVAYDSEENEIDLNEQGKRKKIQMADFLEAEAELSESEWGSEDEDEKGLDQLEFELGDTDKFDEEKVKSDLEKIHMRRMLDDDTREVKLLQELLLEDGEMHGTGRQRQFKWKNMDLNSDQAEEKKDDDDIYMDEEDSEEQWRKKRHEREMFLKQQKSQDINPEEDLLCTSQLLKIGEKFLKRSISSSQSSTTTEKSSIESGSPFNNTLFSIQNKRGSFLNRSDQVLHRVAEYTKVTAEVDVNSKRTTKHFLFQSVSATEVSIASKNGNKRKALEGTPNILKKLRLSTNFSPVVSRKRDKSERSKKLFNF